MTILIFYKGFWKDAEDILVPELLISGSPLDRVHYLLLQLWLQHSNYILGSAD